MGVLSDIDQDEERVVATYGYAAAAGPPGPRISPSALVFRGQSVILLDDLQSHPALRHASWARAAGIRTLAGAAAIAQTGEVVGALWLMDTAPRSWTAEDKAQMERFSALASRNLALRTEVESAKRAVSREESILEGVTEGILTLDRSWRISYMNAAAERLFGCRRSDVLGRSLWREFPGLAGSMLETRFRQAARDRVPATLEADIGARGRWVSLHLTPAAEGLLVNAEDVTGRRRVSDALAASEVQFRSILETAEEGVWRLDSARDTLYVNPRMAQMLGETVDAMVGRSVDEFVFAEDANIALGLFAKIGSGAPARCEFRLQGRDDSEHWARVSAAPVMRDEGAAEGFLLMVTDITEHRRDRESLEMVSARHAAFMENNPAIAFIKDEWSRYVYVNPAHKAITNVPLDRLLGRGDDAWLPADLAKRIRAEDRAVLARNAPAQFRDALPMEDGSVRHFLTTKFPVFGPNGEKCVGGVSVDVTAHQVASEQLHHRAFHDALTGLPNRDLFRDRLEQALLLSARTGRPAAVLLLDMDRFKVVNESLGRRVGDMVLVHAAESLRICGRASDTVARLGGDEFAILRPDVADDEESAELAACVGRELAKRVEIEGREVFVTASIGVVTADGDRETADTVLNGLDVAVLQAKAAGVGRHVVSSRDGVDRSTDRLAREMELRRALERGEFEMHYQPIVRLRDGAVVGLEALARWRHPHLGLTMPGEFIALLEQLGLMHGFTLWALEEVRNNRRVMAPGGTPPRVSVNISARSLHEPNFVGEMAGVLRDGTGASSWLTVEVTEGAVMHDPERALETLRLIAEMGIGVSLDDFGTGYSSLAYLKRLPADEVKIDRTFVEGLDRGDMDDDAIVRATIGLAHHLGKSVVAEGVESEAAMQTLSVMGCDLAQGYFLCRPLPLDAIVEWLAHGERRWAPG
jgi:diguanylate cyclase (GGDEF)-like protein/PAS domain S-box-containing protein